MKKLLFIHAAEAAIKKMNETFSGHYDIYNILDDGLQELFNRKLDDAVVSRIKWHIIGYLEVFNIDACIITCTALSIKNQQAIDRGFPIPVLKVDVPMMEKAIQFGSKICMVATFKPGGEAARSLLCEIAKKNKIDIFISELLIPDAFQALKEGDSEKHDSLVTNAVSNLDRTFDSILLTQVSMAHLAEDLQQKLGVPVLSSPRECLNKIKSMTL